MKSRSLWRWRKKKIKPASTEVNSNNDPFHPFGDERLQLAIQDALATGTMVKEKVEAHKGSGRYSRVMQTAKKVDGQTEREPGDRMTIKGEKAELLGHATSYKITRCQKLRDTEEIKVFLWRE